MNQITLTEIQRNRFEISYDTMKEVTSVLSKYRGRYNRINKHWSYDMIDYEGIKKELMILAVIKEKPRETTVNMVSDAETKKTTITFEYDTQVIDIIKSIPKESREYVPETKSWRIESAYEDEVRDKINNLKNYKVL